MTEEQLEAIKHHCINPVDSRETGLRETGDFGNRILKIRQMLRSFEGFADMPEAQLKEHYTSSLNLAMTFKDFLHIQNYFKEGRTQRSIRNRDPCA